MRFFLFLLVFFPCLSFAQSNLSEEEQKEDLIFLLNAVKFNLSPAFFPSGDYGVEEENFDIFTTGVKAGISFIHNFNTNAGIESGVNVGGIFTRQKLNTDFLQVTNSEISPLVEFPFRLILRTKIAPKKYIFGNLGFLFQSGLPRSSTFIYNMADGYTMEFDNNFSYESPLITVNWGLGILFLREDGNYFTISLLKNFGSEENLISGNYFISQNNNHLASGSFYGSGNYYAIEFGWTFTRFKEVLNHPSIK